MANADRVVPVPLHFAAVLKEKRREPFEHVCLADKQQAERSWRYIKRLMNIEMGCKVYRNKLVPPYPLQEPCRLYDLRHTYCTNLEKQGVPISIASRLMGHANISITAKIYTHENDVSLEIARKLIDGANNSKKSEKKLLKSLDLPLIEWYNINIERR
ncbi:MAG: tyrosine-type recombinase/integrase [Lentihominibacter sp.]